MRIRNLISKRFVKAYYLELGLMTGVLFVIGTLLGHAEQIDPPRRVGRVSYLSGTVLFAPASIDDEWSMASLNLPVTSGDHLWTDEGGRAEIHVGSTAIRLTEFTNVDVLNFGTANN
jgi:hypothetical protein